MNRMRTIGSRKISDTSYSDAYEAQRTAVVGGTSTLGRKMSNAGDIFLHLEFLAIDRTLTHLVSPDATAVETL